MGSASSASQLRILLFLHSFGPGGVERVAMRLAGAWADAGHDVRLLMGRNDGPDTSVAPHNVTYEFAPSSPFLARRFETLWMVRHLVAAVRRNRPDVIFCAGNTYTIVAALVRLLLGPTCPPIVCKLSNSLDRQDLPLIGRLGHRMWLRQHHRFIDHFVGLSEPMRTEIARFLNVGPRRISIIPNPVMTNCDLHELSGSRIEVSPGEGRRFISIGRLTRQKNFSLLLRAFAQIATPDDRLVILGEGPERKRLTKQASKLGISHLVDLAGYRESVSTLLKSSDIFVSSSNYEGMPGAVVEALAAGLSVVATRSSACLTELLGHGRLGRLVAIRDVRDLANALDAAPGRHSLMLPAMRTVAAQFTIERAAHLYVDVLAATAAARARASGWGFEPFAEAA